MPRRPSWVASSSAYVHTPATGLAVMRTRRTPSSFIARLQSIEREWLGALDVAEGGKSLEVMRVGTLPGPIVGRPPTQRVVGGAWIGEHGNGIVGPHAASR